ncbi:S8 family serine peptidase [Streptomyces sp. SCL15-6]|uniref:cyanobactin maturation protease PatG family protein n=1 Tax=Streptomyces sp. SCL15-6 TaxID=2967222 RepID=UPI0029666141|nr:S8 family serine peptidase [Streptomyces sp. SCL15-6]
MRIRSVLHGLEQQEELLGDPEVCIAVLDGPVDLSHPCFAGADLTRLDTLVQDPAGAGPMSVHGTHVASLLFGQPGSPVTGLAPQCRGLILPVFRDAQDWRVPQLDLARAIERAVQEGAHIINVSGGERTPDGHADSLLQRALRLCEDNGVLVVAAVGNDGCDCLQAPAAAPSVLAVGAAGPTGEPLPSNNWGAAYGKNGVLAPGLDIEGAAPGGRHASLAGSSFATPAVAGVAALLVAAQLRAGRDAAPLEAKQAILDTATRPSCSPGDSPECRRHLGGHLNAAGAYGLVTRTTPADPDPASIPPRAVQPAAWPAGAASESGVNAAGEPSSLRMPRSVPNEGASAMHDDQAVMSEGAEGARHTAESPGEAAGGASEAPVARPLGTLPLPESEGVGSAGETTGVASEAPVVSPPGTLVASEAQPTPPQPDGHATEASAPKDPTAEPNVSKGSNAMDSPSAAVAASGATTSAAETPPTAAPVAQSAPVGQAQVQEQTPSPDCGCGGATASGCQCAGNGNGARRQLIYAIGTIGFDYQTDARRDFFRQQMPQAPGPTVDGKETENPPNIYDPRQLYTFLAKKPWMSDKLTWTLMLDSTPIYALEAETPMGMDWHQPLITNPKATADQVGAAAATTAGDEARLAHVLETLSYPPVSHVYRIFRDAILGQIQPPDDPNYVSRVAIPGELTGRTTRLFNGTEVPVVKVRATDQLATWNEFALVDAVVKAVKKAYTPDTPDATAQQNATAQQEAAAKEAALKTTVRALLDKVYYQFRNLGQSAPDRALNFAGTNAFLVGAQLQQGLMSAEHVPGSKKNFYTLDTVSVAKSPYGRPGSDCWDVTLVFFDPEDDRRARVSYLFTFDVSEDPVSLGPVHHFIGS